MLASYYDVIINILLCEELRCFYNETVVKIRPYRYLRSVTITHVYTSLKLDNENEYSGGPRYMQETKNQARSLLILK